MWITTSSKWELATTGVKAAVVAGQPGRYKSNGGWIEGIARHDGDKINVMCDHRYVVNPGSWLQVWMPPNIVYPTKRRAA